MASPAALPNASLTAANPLFSAPAFGNALGTFHTPRYQEWSLQIEQQLDSKSSMTLAYIGNHGIHEPVTNFPNQALGAAGIPAAPFSDNFSTITEVYSGAVSNDNQLTASYQRRLTYGFTVMASYTWAHAMDEISNGGFLGYSATSTEYQYNLNNLRSNYGNSDYDIRSSFNAQYVWNTPVQVQQQVRPGSFRRLDALAELLCPHRTASDRSRRLQPASATTTETSFRRRWLVLDKPAAAAPWPTASTKPLSLPPLA